MSASAAPTTDVHLPGAHRFQGGADWEPALATDRYGHVYALWSHYVGFGGGSSGEPDPSCPTCASPHSVLQVSNDGGQTWGSLHAGFPALTRQDDPQIVVDPADGRTVYAAYMFGAARRQGTAVLDWAPTRGGSVITERCRSNSSTSSLSRRATLRERSPGTATS